MLGEKLFDDTSYTGETGESAFSVQYYRDKAREFQEVLNQTDAAARAAQMVIDADVDIDLVQEMETSLREYQLKRGVLRGAAEAINMGAAAINSLGGRMPQLSIPTGLGFLPAIPAAAAAAFVVAAGLVVWGAQWVSGVNERMRLALLSGSITDPAKRDALLSALGMAEAAQKAVEVSPLTSIAGVVKWGAIALGLWLAYRAFQQSGYAK